jgi:hypothetical protein
MAQNNVAMWAALVALAFLALALSACATPEQHAAGPANIAPIVAPATPEFHAAPVGDDLLRSRLEG